jgi:tetratricopeptide (TPR) repeat protein
MDHYLYSVRTLLKMDIDHVLPGHGGISPNIGHWVTEETYDGLIRRMLGYESMPLLEGAQLLAEKGLLEEALFLINKAVAQEQVEEHLEALEFKAMLLNDLGRPQEALESFDQVLAKNPGKGEVLLGKGCSLMGLGRYEESLALFNEALQQQPQSPEAQIYKGMALYLAGRLEEAMELPAFRQEFASRLKSELEKLSAEKGSQQGS